nr:HEAT repeat domain-containing protein [Methanosarcina barkeri]
MGRNWGSKSRESLISALSDKDPEVRSLVVESLGKIGEEEATGALVQQLKDPDQKVRNITEKNT